MKNLKKWLLVSSLLKDDSLDLNIDELLKKNRKASMNALKFNQVEKELIEPKDQSTCQCETCGEPTNKTYRGFWKCDNCNPQIQIEEGA